jgi:hypothetical protein
MFSGSGHAVGLVNVEQLSQLLGRTVKTTVCRYPGRLAKIMIPSLRMISRIPLDRLWDEDGEIEATRGRSLSKSALREMLRQYPVEFCVAEIGCQLRRMDIAKCYDFWKSEADAHVVDDPEFGFRLEDFPDEYAYIASEWSGQIQAPVVLLEKYH